MIPPLYRPGPITIRAEVGKVTLPSGNVITKDKYGQPLKYPLAEAIRRAQYYADSGPQVIGAGPGIHHGAHIGGVGSNAYHAYDAYWLGGEVIRDLTITSLDPNNRAQCAFAISGDTRKTGGGGVDGLTLWQLSMRNQGYSKFTVIVFMGSHQGMIRYYKNDWSSLDPKAWNGHGVMTHCREHGWCLTDGRENEFDKAQEHCWYLPALQGDSCLIGTRQIAPSGRTCIQVEERMTEMGYSGDPNWHGTPLASQGALTIKRTRAWTSQSGGGSGASITIAGHSGGPVTIEDTEVKGDNGAILFWCDKPKGLALTPNGYTCPWAIIKGVRSDHIADTDDLIAFGGVERVDIHLEMAGPVPLSFLDTNRTAIHEDSQYTHSVKSGTLRLHAPGRASGYAGFAPSAVKVRQATAILSNAQIDALQVAGPVTP